VTKLIVDSSVWIDFFRGKLKPEIRQYIVEFIQIPAVSITDIIRHELLIGAPTLKSYQQLSDLLSPLECLRIREEELFEFDKFAWNLKRKGVDGKYKDLSIAFLSASRKIPLLSFDRYFDKLSALKIIETVHP